MEIRMRTLSAGPRGVRQANKKYDVDAAEAKDLIAGGFAVPADGTKPARVERAVSAGATETATGEAQQGDAATGEPGAKGAPKSRAKKPVK